MAPWDCPEGHTGLGFQGLTRARGPTLDPGARRLQHPSRVPNDTEWAQLCHCQCQCSSFWSLGTHSHPPEVTSSFIWQLSHTMMKVCSACPRLVGRNKTWGREGCPDTSHQEASAPTFQPLLLRHPPPTTLLFLLCSLPPPHLLSYGR